MPTANKMQHRRQLRICAQDIAGHIARASPRHHLVRGQSEYEDVVRAHMFSNFNVGAIQGADGEGAVQRQLHVACAARLKASGGNLLREIGRRHHLLRERNVIVRQERHFQPSGHHRVGIHGACHVIHQLDDCLRHGVARRRLAGKHHGARHEIRLRRLQNALIAPDHIEQVQ